MSAGISEAVREFIFAAIDGVEPLEILLLLHAEQPREWTAAQVAARLRTNVDSTTRRLAELAKRKLLSVQESADGPRYGFASGGSAAAVVDELARTYQTHRVAVITLIFSRPTEEIRNFSGAFRIRRD